MVRVCEAYIQENSPVYFYLRGGCGLLCRCVLLHFDSVGSVWAQGREEREGPMGKVRDRRSKRPLYAPCTGESGREQSSLAPCPGLQQWILNLDDNGGLYLEMSFRLVDEIRPGGLGWTFN